MAKLQYFIFFTLVLFTSVLCRPGKKVELSPLEELQARAQFVVNNITKTFGIKDLPDSKKIVQAINTQTQNLATHAQEISNKLKSEMKAHQPEIDNVIKSVQEKLAETATSLQKLAGPDATAKVKDAQTSFNNGVKTVVEEVEKLVKAVEPDATKVKSNVQSAAQTFLNQVIDIGKNLQSQVKTTITDHEKTHLH